MKSIVDNTPDLAGVLPQAYGALPDAVLRELMRLLAPLQIAGDAYGLIFEYFMGSSRRPSCKRAASTSRLPRS
jgi:type I restriction enzyme M protein